MTFPPLLLHPCLLCLVLLPVRRLLADLLITEHIECSFSRISQELSKSRDMRRPGPLIIPCPSLLQQFSTADATFLCCSFFPHSGSCPLFNLCCQLMVLIGGQSIEENVIPSLTRHWLLRVITVRGFKLCPHGQGSLAQQPTRTSSKLGDSHTLACV